MKHLISTILCFTISILKGQESSSFLTLQYCSSSSLDTLSLAQGIHPEFLRTNTKKKLKIHEFFEEEKEGCVYYKILLENQMYSLLYVNRYTFDTLFLSINLEHDSLINLNELDGGYTKVSNDEFLLKDMNIGDKISIAYEYPDCPQYGSGYRFAFEIVFNGQIRNLYSRKNKIIKNLKIEDLQSFEKSTKNLEKGEALKIQIRKNNQYQVYKCYLQSTTQLPDFLMDWERMK